VLFTLDPALEVVFYKPVCRQRQAPRNNRKKQTDSFLNEQMLATKCMDCQSDTAKALAWPLRGIRKIRTTHYIYSLVKNPMQFAEKNKTAKKAYAKRGLQMPPFPDLTKAEIKAILDYFDSISKSKKD
jgi:dTDP-4-amino-4,6-dideoxygalactose transaminase